MTQNVKVQEARQGPTSRDISTPSYVRKLVLKTLQAQKVVKRNFTRVAGAMYRMDVVYRIVSGDKDAEKVDLVIGTMFTNAEDELDIAVKHFEELIEENGIDQMPEYDLPVEEHLKVTSPQVGRYIQVIQKLEKLCIDIDALWLSGIIGNKERNNSVYKWQQKVIGLGARLIGLERTFREEARKQGKEGELPAMTPDEVAEEASEKKDSPKEATQESPEGSAKASKAKGSSKSEAEEAA